MNKILSLLLIMFCFTLYQNNKAYCNDQSPHIQQNIGYVKDLNLALKLSKETNQKILLIFSASWCAACENLKYNLHKLNNLDNKIICILDTEEEKKLTKKFKVKTLPYSLIININGDIVSSHVGYVFSSYNEWLSNEQTN